MKNYVFAKEDSCQSVRRPAKAIKKNVTSTKSRLLQIDVCIIHLMNIATALKHR
jgi:hypothetical protein